MNNKELLERQRLANRREGFARYEYTENVMHQERTAAGFMADSERFARDVAAQAKVEREQAYQRRQHQYDNLRQTRAQRDEDRWKQMEDAQREEQQKWEALRGTSKNNQSSVAYDVISMQYYQNQEGHRLADSETGLQNQAVARAERLYAKQSSEGINPITGEQLPILQNSQYATGRRATWQTNSRR